MKHIMVTFLSDIVFPQAEVSWTAMSVLECAVIMGGGGAITKHTVSLQEASTVRGVFIVFFFFRLLTSFFASFSKL